MRIPQSFIDEVKYRNKIEDVIASYVNLKRAGSNYQGLCPFHSEKTPSFTVFPNTETFHCFGCGAGGDVISFIMRAENLEYPGAVEFLAKRAGLEMPEEAGGAGSETVKRSRMYEMNRAAAVFFNKMLYAPESEPAREYLKQRGLSSAAVKRFGLGFAPNSFDALRRHMHSLGSGDDELKEAFLCGKSERTGGYFDYFRGRLIFPIIDNFSNVIAFGGRALGDGKPKYLNTSDTPVFKKSRNLFALNFAKNACAESLILCEGYMDVIAVNMAGFPNAVATLGTALTTEQARIMAKYTKKVILSYDSDDAGELRRKIVSDTLGYGDRINRDFVGNAKAARAEEAIIGILLLRPELVPEIKKGRVPLAADDFVTQFNKRVFEAILDCEGKCDIGLLGQDFSVEEIDRITAMQVKRASLTKNDLEVLTDNVRTLKSEAAEKNGTDELEDIKNLLNIKKK